MRGVRPDYLEIHFRMMGEILGYIPVECVESDLLSASSSTNDEALISAVKDRISKIKRLEKEVAARLVVLLRHRGCIGFEFKLEQAEADVGYCKALCVPLAMKYADAKVDAKKTVGGYDGKKA